jgi:two-component system, LytTR family, sensor kinase
MYSINLQKKPWITLLPVVLHLGFWLLFASILFFFKPPMPDDINSESKSVLLSMFVLQIPFFYINAYSLIPRLLYKNRGFLYFLSVVGTGVSIIFFHQLFLKYWILDQISERFQWRFIFGMPVFFMWTISTCYRLLVDNFRKEQERKEQETERLKSELSFLRSQISPHFMFNVLNSIVSLARKKSDKVEPVVIQLSELMRYMLYESDETQVPLHREINYLQSYIDLQRLRFGNAIEIRFSTENTDLHLLIEPMLLIPFVENAFKHGTGIIANPTIEIQASTHSEMFRFQVGNTVNPLFLEEKDNSSGIGLANVERRLKLLYPDAHQLHIHRTPDWYAVDLTIRLKKEANKPQKKTILSPDQPHEMHSHR